MTRVHDPIASVMTRKASMSHRLLPFKQLTILLVAVSVVMAFSASVAHAATPAWKLLAATGPTNLAPWSNDSQTVWVGAASGTFKLTFDGSSTVDLAYDASAGAVESALNALPTVNESGGSVSVSGGPGDPWAARPFEVVFDGGPLAGSHVPLLVASNGATPLANDGAQGGVRLSVNPTISSTILVYATNVGGSTTTGAYTIDIDLPAGITSSRAASGEAAFPEPGGNGMGEFSCTPTGIGHTSVSCTRSTPVVPGQSIQLNLPVTVNEPIVGPVSVRVGVDGGGAGSTTYDLPLTISSTPAAPGIQSMWAAAFDENGNPETRAGAHPNLAGTVFHLNTITARNGKVIPAGNPRDIAVDLPLGFVGNPLVTPRCKRATSVPGGASPCPIEAQVGAAQPMLQFLGSMGTPNPLTNVMPPEGSAAELDFGVVWARAATLAKLRASDYGVSTLSPNLPVTWHVYGAAVSLFGTPPESGGRAFLTNPTDCPGSVLTTMMRANSWEFPSFFDGIGSDSPATTECDTVPFEPELSVTPTVTRPDAATGLEFDLSLPQDGLLDTDEIATSHLRDVVVDLPDGLVVNPSGATGLEGCTDAQMDKGTKSVPACPDGSKLGTVRVTSPLVDHAIDGAMYLGTPKSTDPMSGQMLRLWVVARDDDLGVMVKLPGSATADPATGKLKATFRDNPRLPFDSLDVKLKGGERGVLATPQACGPQLISTVLAPWSGGSPANRDTTADFTGQCTFGFAPRLKAGMSASAARATGDFSFKFSREDGEQWVNGLTAQLPAGLLATIKGLPLCPSVQAEMGACPTATQIGTVDATAGSGDPFVLEQKGQAFLTEGYKGCAYGLVAVVPVVAGPFDGTSPETDLGDIVVRQKICVDPTTARVTAVSDPLPTIWHGIPTRVRSVTVAVDRPSFMLNPSSCRTNQVDATLDSAWDASANVSRPFNVVGCKDLAFKPKLTLGLSGRKQVTTGKHPGIRAKVTQQGVSEAGIEKAVVRLPKSLALDVNNAQALCEFADGTKPDLENHCPKGSIVGRATAVTPLLNDPLAGNVYFVKNVRKDPKTGNEIRTLPMIVVALRGEIAINLEGESDTTKSGKLVSTFASVPDAPISQFNLNIQGGKNGILAVTRTRRAKINLCAQPKSHVAESDIDGHNGRRHDTDIRMKTPCSKRQIRAARRVARARGGVASGAGVREG